jgi:arginine deiminase
MSDVSINDRSVNKEYGIEKFGRLKKAILHNPINSIKLVNKSNYELYLFDGVPNVDRYLDEHSQYSRLLKSHGVEVFELSDYVHQNRELMNNLPNLTYLHDSSVVTSSGAILSKMANWGRVGEDIVVKEALTNLKVPIFYEFGTGDKFEGCLLLSPKTILIANTERHTAESIEKFIPYALKLFDEIIYVDIPKERRFMHPDMIYNRISENLSLAFLPAFLHTYLITKNKRSEIDFYTFLKGRNIEIINISDDEQIRWGCSFVPLEPNAIFNYDISLTPETERILRNFGVKLIQFHPDALLAGGGSLRCITLRLLRES